MLGVTTELLAAGGYDALTISEVAARAGVGRQMIYRWWPTKRDLVASALFAHGSVVWPTVYRGPLADDLRVLITALVGYTSRPAVQAGMLGLIADLRASDPAPPEIEEGFVGPLRESFERLCEAGWERGDLTRDFDPTLTLTSLRGAVTAHLLHLRRNRGPVVEHLVALMSRALAPPPG